MSRNRKRSINKNRSSNRVDSTNYNQLLNRPANNQENKPLPESVQLVNQVSTSINRKIMPLINNISKLRTFHQEKISEEHSFFENNYEQIDSLLNIDLVQTYQQLIENYNVRDRLYQGMVDHGVITAEELEDFKGTVGNTAYSKAISRIRQHKTAPEALTDHDVLLLENARLEDMPTLLDDLKAANKLSDLEATRLLSIGPKNEEQLAEARRNILVKIQRADLQNSVDPAGQTTFYNQYTETVHREEQLEDKIDSYNEQYNRLMKSLVEQIQQMHDQDNNEKKQNERLRAIGKETGLPIKKGAVLYAEDWFEDPMNRTRPRQRTNRVEINDVSYGFAEESGDINPELKVSTLSFEPVIHFTVTPENNNLEPVSYKLSSAGFKDWLISNNVAEKVNDLTDLEEKIGLVDFIKVGQTFEYNLENEDSENAETIIKEAKIVDIGNDYIEFDEPIVLDPVHEGSGLVHARQAKRLNFGDFARWYRKTNSVPVLHQLEKADEFLKQFHQSLNKEMGWPPETGKPINLSKSAKPLLLISAFDPKSKNAREIIQAKDQKITFADGQEMSVTDFLRTVVKEGLVIPNPEQMQELATIAANKHEEAERQKINDLMAKHNIPVTTNDNVKTHEKEGDLPAAPPMGYFKSLWKSTRFLNLMEAYDLFIKTPTARIKEVLADRSERRLADVGKNWYKGIPYLGLGDLAGRYEAKANGKVAEDVKKKEEFYDNNLDTAGVTKILYDLKSKPDTVVLKAALQYLSKKGVLRWEDDKALIDTINAHALSNTVYPDKYVKQAGEFLQNRHVVVGDKEVLDKGLSIFDQYRIVLDNLYKTDGMFDSLNSTNERQYLTEKENASKNMHKYEFLQGGIEANLQRMLYNFENGEDVNQAEFEGLLTQAMANVEVSIQEGMLLFISAFGMKRKKDGRTLLPFSRLNPFIPALKELVMYVYFALNYPLRDEDGNIIMDKDEKGEDVPRVGKFSTNNFSYLYETVVKKDLAFAQAEATADGKGDIGAKKFTASKNMVNWIQSEVLVNPKAKTEITKAAGNPANIAAYPYLAPTLVSEDDIDKLITKGWGAQAKTQVPGNMYAGFNNQLLIRANRLTSGDSSAQNELRGKELQQMVNSFLYFNHIMRGKIYKGSDRYLKFSKLDYAEKPVADKYITIEEFAQQTEEFTRNLALGVAALAKDPILEQLTRDILFTSTTDTAVDVGTESDFRTRLGMAMQSLSKTNPKGLAQLASSAAQSMKGMSGVGFSKKELEAQQAQAA